MAIKSKTAIKILVEDLAVFIKFQTPAEYEAFLKEWKVGDYVQVYIKGCVSCIKGGFISGELEEIEKLRKPKFIKRPVKVIKKPLAKAPKETTKGRKKKANVAKK